MEKSGPVAGFKRDLSPRTLILLLVLLTLALYWPATQCRFIDFDDPYYVTANPVIQKGVTLASLSWISSHVVLGNWHPVTMFSHLLDCQFFGLKPWGHHLTSILIHGLNTILVFYLLRQLTGTVWRSFFVAALFGLHPLRVESVVWIAERKDVLSGCFGLLCLIFYARYAKKQMAGVNRPAHDHITTAGSPTNDYLIAWLFLTLGLMSKAMLVTWPFLMLVLDYWPLQRFHIANLGRLFREKIPFLISSVLLSIITFFVQKQTGAMEMLDHLSFSERVQNALVAYCLYVEKIFWPADLAVVYPHPGHWPVWTVVAAGIILVGVSILFWLRRTHQPFLLTGWLWYCGTLVPVIGIVQVGNQAMADRYSYLPSLGIMICLVWGIYELAQNRRDFLTAATAVGAASILLCLGITRHQIGYWHDSETLFRHTLQVTRHNATALINLGVALDEQGRYQEAITEYQAALQLKPNSAEYHNSLGFDLGNLGNSAAAIQQYQIALQLKPEYAECHNNLGVEYGSKGDTAGALREFQAAVHFKPDYAEACNNLGLALYQSSQFDQAIQAFEQALRLKSDFIQAQQGLQAALNARNTKSSTPPAGPH